MTKNEYCPKFGESVLTEPSQNYGDFGLTTKGNKNMRQYETMVIVDAMISDEAIDAEVQGMASIISTGGETLRRDDWGKRKMAYSINKKTHGYYVIFYYKAEVSVVAALEAAFKHNENLLRWMTLVDYPMTEIIYDKNLVQTTEDITPIDVDDVEVD